MRLGRVLVVGCCVLAMSVAGVDSTTQAWARSFQDNGRQPGSRPPQGGNKPGKPPQGASKPSPGRPGQRPPAQGRPPAQNRPPSQGRPPSQNKPRPPQHRPPQQRPVHGARPHYNFGDGGNGFRLRRYFNTDMGRINRGRRPHFLPGGYFPRQYVTYLQPIPVDVLGYLPAVPPGYAIGYYDGYTVVYDPRTYFILSVLDLFRY